MGASLCGFAESQNMVERIAFNPPAQTVEGGDVLQLSVEEFGKVPMLHLAPSAQLRGRRRRRDVKAAADASAASTSSGDLVLLVSHGNGTNVRRDERMCKFLCSLLGVDVIIYDYPGYGGNTCSPSERGAFAAAESAFAYAVEHVAVDSSNVIVMGHSLGTGPAVELARTRRCAALVLQAPLRSVMRVMFPRLPLTPYMDIMANEDKMCDLPDELPLYIVHSFDDTVIPVSHGQDLAQKAEEHMNNVTVWWPDGVGHNDLQNHEEYARRLTQFVEKHLTAGE